MENYIEMSFCISLYRGHEWMNCRNCTTTLLLQFELWGSVSRIRWYHSKLSSGLSPRRYLKQVQQFNPIYPISGSFKIKLPNTFWLTEKRGIQINNVEYWECVSSVVTQGWLNPLCKHTLGQFGCSKNEQGKKERITNRFPKSTHQSACKGKEDWKIQRTVKFEHTGNKKCLPLLVKTCVQLMPSWLGLPMVAATIGDTMFLSSNLCTACAEEHQNLRLTHSVSFSCLDELTKCFPCFKIPRPLLCWIFINGVYFENKFHSWKINWQRHDYWAEKNSGQRLQALYMSMKMYMDVNARFQRKECRPEQ